MGVEKPIAHQTSFAKGHPMTTCSAVLCFLCKVNVVYTIVILSEPRGRRRPAREIPAERERENRIPAQRGR
jgi:hypothetical protein